jgi:hypothetical protein
MAHVGTFEAFETAIYRGGLMKPKHFAPPHIIRLTLEDEERLKAMSGKASANLRELVHEAMKARHTP